MAEGSAPEERTEDPTAKRIEQLRKDNEVLFAEFPRLRVSALDEHLKEVESPPAFGGTPGRPTLGSYCRSPVFARLRWLAEGLAHGHHRRNGQQ